MESKGQAAVEMLVTYSWAFMIIALFLVIVFIVSFSRPASSYLQSTCSIQPLLPCGETVLSSYASGSPIRYLVTFTNNMGTAIYVPANGFNASTQGIGVAGRASWLGNCTPQLVPNRGSATCSATVSGTQQPSAGTSVLVYFSISYGTCSSLSQSSCSGASYRTTGFSQQQIGSGVTLYIISLATSNGKGYVAIDGTRYPSGTTITLQAGVHSAYGVPPSGYAWGQWSSSGLTVGSAGAQNTSITVSGNGSLTAGFTATGSGGTTGSSSTVSTSSITTTVYCISCRS